MRSFATALVRVVALLITLTGAISPIAATKAKHEAGSEAPKKLMKSEQPLAKQLDSRKEPIERVQISPVGIILTDANQVRQSGTETETASSDVDFDPSKSGFDKADAAIGSNDGTNDGDHSENADPTDDLGLLANQATWNFSAEPFFQDGVRIYRPASNSKIIKLTAEQEACLRGDSLVDCWKAYGSYGTRRLKAQYFETAGELGLLNPNWMASLQVQGRRIYNLTFPGTHQSAMYAKEGSAGQERGYGVITQSLNITEQLAIGIRALDIWVSWDAENQQAMASCGTAARPLVPLLLEVQSFIESNPSEIVMISLRLDTNPAAAPAIQHLQALDWDTTKVPGWTFHSIMNATFGPMLINAASLSSLPNDNTSLPYAAQLQNPLVATLVDANLNILYFYQGQQVMCYDLAACEATPGYSPGSASAGTVIQPLNSGVREQHYADQNTSGDVAIEPACIIRSTDTFKDKNPFELIRDVQSWINLDRSVINWTFPACLSPDVKLATWYSAPFFFSLEAVLTYTASDVQATQQLLANSSRVYSRGEGFGQTSPAEHFNFLLLAWLMRIGWAQKYTLPNVIYMDYAMPVFVQRIIEPMQGHQDCGWAISCAKSGSCWALSKLSEMGTCRRDSAILPVLTALKNEDALARSQGTIYNGQFEVLTCLASIFICAMVIALFCCLVPFLVNSSCKQVTKADLAREEFGEFGDQGLDEDEHAGQELKKTTEGDSAPEAPEVAPPPPGKKAAAAEP